MKTRSKTFGWLLSLALCFCMVLAMLATIPLAVEAATTCTHVDKNEDGRCDTCNDLMAPAQLIKTSASLEGNIAVNYFMLLSDEIKADPTAYMQFTVAGDDPIRVPVSDGKSIEDYWVFTCEVNAKEMTDVITSQFYYGGQAAFEKDHKYTVRTYAERVSGNNNDEKARTLMRAMVNYGAASQIYFGYNTGDLANTGVTTTPDYSKVNITGFDFERGQGTDKVKLYTASLILNTETTLRLFFNGNFTATYQGKPLEVKYRGGLYYVDIVGIAAKYLDDDVTITINDGTADAKITFSAMAYCQIVQQDTTGAFSTEMKDLACALYLYNQAANAYFHEDPTEGFKMSEALHYLNGNGTKITTQVNRVIFGQNKDYANITKSYAGTLIDEGQDVPVYAYYVLDSGKYDIYVLANYTVYAPATSTNLFKGMTNLTSVETDNFDVSRAVNMKAMFRECTKLTELNVTGWDTSNVTDMAQVFYKCTALKTITGLEKWNTGAVTTMQSMFRECGVAGDLDLRAWDVDKVTTMKTMFFKAPNIVNLNANGWDTGACTDMGYMFTSSTKLESVDAAGWNTSKVTSMYGMFNECNGMKTLNVTGWDTSNVTDATFMFTRCRSLESFIGSGGLNFGKVTNMSAMCEGWDSLTYLDATNWNCGSCTNMAQMFGYALKLETIEGIENWDVSKVESFSTMFIEAYELKDLNLSTWNTGNGKNFNSMFSYCSEFNPGKDTFDNWDMSEAVNINHMFYGCGSIQELNLSGWNMPKMVTTSHMFADCFNLKSIDLSDWYTPSVTSLDCMFNHCGSLTSLDVSSFDTSNCEEFSQLFEYCSSLEVIDGLDNWDTSNALTYESTFSGCSALKELDLRTFNTRNVVNEHDMAWQPDPNDPNIGYGCLLMFDKMNSLEKLILGADFSFDGDGKVTDEANKISLPAPAPKEGFIAKWKNVKTGETYLASKVPEKVAATYVAYYEYIPKGAKMVDAIHYLNADPAGTQITNNVTAVVYGKTVDYPQIVDSYEGYLADVGQDTEVYAYYVNNSKAKAAGDTYTVYFLSDGVIYAPENSTKLFNQMSNLESVNTSNLDTSRVTNMTAMFQKCAKLKKLDVSNWDVSKVANFTGTFINCNVLEELIGIGNWNTSSATTFSRMFEKCYKLTSVNVSGWKTTNVTSMMKMFFLCESLVEVQGTANWDTSNVTDMTSVFDSAKSLQSVDVSKWATGKVENMGYMFYNCKSLKTLAVSDWDLSNVQSMEQTFFGCSQLAELDVSDWNVGQVQNFYCTFTGNAALTSLDVSQWDTSSATTMGNMFQGCSGLTELDVSNWDVSDVTGMQYMFAECTALSVLDPSQWDTGSVVLMSYMFYNDSSITSLVVSDWDVSQVQEMNNMFYACSALTEVDMSRWDVGNVQTFEAMFGYASNLQTAKMDNWQPTSATSFLSMFHDCVKLQSADVSGWQLPNLLTASHMFRGCNSATFINVSGWYTPKLASMDAMFHTCKTITTVDLSSFDTSKCLEMSQIFEHATGLQYIEGLDKLNTASAKTFQETFAGCTSLRELDLRNFNTRNVVNEHYMASQPFPNKPNIGYGYRDMFDGMTGLEKLVLGADFSFDGDAKVTDELNKVKLPAPNNAEGLWYDEDGIAYTPDLIPQEKAATYYAVNPVATP